MFTKSEPYGETQQLFDCLAFRRSPFVHKMATGFHSTAVKLLPFMGATTSLALLGVPFPFPMLPGWALGLRMVRPENGEGKLAWLFKVVFFNIVWSAVQIGVLAGVPLFLLGVQRLTAIHYLAPYIPTLIIDLHIDRRAPVTNPNRGQYGTLAAFILRLFFDSPLIAMAFVLREVFGLRLFAPFAEVISDDIVQGSCPMPSDVATLSAPPYNVCAVVNMCREWEGPKAAYRKHSIVQLWLPHQDTTAPMVDPLREGCAFISDILEANPGKRVFVHCKGGIGRATTMSLAHHIVNRGLPAAEAIASIKKRRAIASVDVLLYDSIVRIEEERAGKGKHH